MPRGPANCVTPHALHAHHQKHAPHALSDSTFTKASALLPVHKHISAMLCSINARNASLLVTLAPPLSSVSRVRPVFFTLLIVRV